MTIENARVLHKHFLEIGRLDKAKQLVDRYPELAETEEEPKEEPKEVEEDVKESEG